MISLLVPLPLPSGGDALRLCDDPGAFFDPTGVEAGRGELRRELGERPEACRSWKPGPVLLSLFDAL